MSGPKDFNIIYAAIRAWQIQQRMKREAEIRAAALAREMELNRQRATEILERGRSAREQKTQTDLEEKQPSLATVKCPPQQAGGGREKGHRPQPEGKVGWKGPFRKTLHGQPSTRGRKKP